MTTLYHNPRCRKSREALQLLQQANEPIEIVLYLKDTLGEDEIKNILGKLEISAIDLVRKNELTWKENYKGKKVVGEDIVDELKLVEYVYGKSSSKIIEKIKK